jgi:hypothetical protein
MDVRAFAAVACLVALGGCGGPPEASSSPVTHESCTATCNGSYDSCMDRFSGIGGAGPDSGGVNAPAKALGPNDVCSDQLKSCLRSCLN